MSQKAGNTFFVGGSTLKRGYPVVWMNYLFVCISLVLSLNAFGINAGEARDADDFPSLVSCADTQDSVGFDLDDVDDSAVPGRRGMYLSAATVPGAATPAADRLAEQSAPYHSRAPPR